MASCALGVLWMLVRWMGVVVHVCDIVVVFVCCVLVVVVVVVVVVVGRVQKKKKRHLPFWRR